MNGINLSRDAGLQAKDRRGDAVTITGITTGDLVFFDSKDDRKRINHVGIACGDGTFIHSTGGIGVTISRLDEEYYQRNFHGARRII